MSDNPMYWPGHQRPAWHQQPPTGQPVNTMSHYATHTGNMLGAPMGSVGMPGADPSLQMQSSIPGRHQPHQSTLGQHQSSLPPPPPGSQSTLYPGMMSAPGAQGSTRPATQLTSNSHLSAATQGIPPHANMQQPQHPQSHYPHQYSSLATSYWNPPPMNNQSASAGSTGVPPPPPPGSGPSQPTQPSDGSTTTYHSTSASPLTMPNDSRGGLSSNPSATMQPQAVQSSFHSPKDIQASSDHMMSSYDRRGSMSQQQQQQQQQQQHPTAMMSQNVPSSTASNLSPTNSQMSIQGRLQSQSQLDPMRSMSQQSSAVSNWSSSYYGQPTQSPYSSVMNPYMPYGSSGTVPPTHNSSVVQTSTRPPVMVQKPSTNGSERARAAAAAAAAYPPHGTSSLYGQPAPPTGGSNGSYYGYDSYYNQAASQAPSDPYLTHPSSANASGAPQHWPSSASSNQMISNSSTAPAPLPIQPPLRPPQAGASGSSIHPQSPSATSSTLPSLSSRSQPPPSQTPDRSPAPQHTTSSYPSPNQQQQQQQPSQQQPPQQQGSTSKSASNSLAQLEQMAIAMPGTVQNTTSANKSPTQRSSTSSPSAQHAQQQLQYSYNSSGQGSYFSTGSNAAPNQSSYYSQYESSGVEMQKSGWSDQPSTGPPVMMDGGQNSYGQPTGGYDTSGAYGDYTSLSTPSNSMQPRFSTSGDTTEPHSSDKGDPYAIDSQTFDDFDDQSSSSKTKKGRAKKGEEKVKKERKPRVRKSAKAAAAAQPMSPAASASLQQLQNKPPLPPTLSHTPDMSPAPGPQSHLNSYPSPSQQTAVPTNLNPPGPLSEMSAQVESSSMLMPTTRAGTPSKSPAHHRLSTDSPNSQQPTMPQQQQVPYNTGSQSGYYSATSNLAPTPSTYYPTYEAGAEAPKTWPEQEQQHGLTHPSHQQPPTVTGVENSVSLAAPTVSTLLPQASSVNSYPSPTAQSVHTVSAPGPVADGPPQIETTMLHTANRATTPSKSPAHRLSTESSTAPPTMSQPQQQQQHQLPYGTRNQSGYYSSTPNVATSQSTYYPSYETGVETQKTCPEQEQQDLQQQQQQQQQQQEQSETTSVSPLPPQPSSQQLEPAPATLDGGEENQHASEATDKKSDTPAAKPKKSRAKKSEEKPKKERKPRAAKAQPQPPAPVEKPPTPTPPPQEEEVIEPQASQSTTETAPAEAKPKRIRIRDSSSKSKKKLPKFALKFAKTKKRKRLGSSDNDQSDLDKTPPPSPDEVESGVLKRRSARNTKKLKYNDDIALGFSDSDDDSQVPSKPKKSSSSANVTIDGENSTLDDTVITDEPTVYAAPVEDTMVVEKIMAHRTGKRELEPEPGEVLPPDGTHIEVEEFYVKYKNLSYLHCDWRTLEELEKGDRRVAQKIKRYKQKKDSSNLFSFMDEDLFDPQYCEVDRILAVNEVEELVPDEDEELEKTSNELIKPPVEDQAVEENQTTTDKPNETDANETPKSVEDKADVESKPSVTKDEQAIESTPAESSTSDVEKVKLESEVKTEALDGETKMESSDIETSTPITKLEETSKDDNDVTMEDDQLTEPEKPKKMKKKISRHYLVKWRGLSYEDCTWELEDDLDPEKIKQFERFKDPPPKSKWKPVKRPKPEEWAKKDKSPVYKNNNTLREYQLEGINWLSYCWHHGRNCILADEMGLGKTIQSIAFVNEIYQKGIYGPFLIIVPLSTIGNWAREFETWTDLNVITYHGSSTSREMLKEYEMFYRNEQGNRITSYYKFQVMITTFEVILSDCLDLREIPWRCCIIDEAHRLKNRNCKLLEGLRLLNMEHRVLLTGTPLQNNVEELFSLLNFLEPTQFSSTEQFLQEFGDLKTEAQVDKLKLILKPMMLRRLKEDVEKTLAPKEETIVEVELTNIQKKYYRAILERNFSFLTKGSSSNNMPNLMNTMMELRKCCIHPYLINGAEDQIEYEARQAKLAGGEPMTPHQAMVNSSGKLVLIDKLLPRLRADGHRVLIFSQMVKCLDILEDYVLHKQYPFERIDGQVKGIDRQQAIDRFSKPGSDRFVFLLCTRAGGLGINLTAADTVIIFDSDWNPQNDLQAQARCHRIGQSKAVKIYRLICRNTYEREMFDKASLKLGLDKAVLQSMNTQKGGTGGIDGQLTKKEIEELLRKGAYGALMDDENAGDKFCEEDIDQILQRRTQVITIDNSEAKGSTFSKATFSSSNNREDIELDDPNFWEKWAKKANIDSDELLSKDELIQLAPRRRTQTKRYGADGNLIDISDLDSSEEDEETISMRTRGSRGRQPKLLPSSGGKRSKRNRMFEFEDDDFLSELEAGYWHKSDCLKVEKGLLTFGWGRWNEIISSTRYKRDLTPKDCESICRVILLYCVNNYKGDEKIKSFSWELIQPPEESNKSQSDFDSSSSSRGRKPKSSPIMSKRTIAEEMADAKWTREAKNDPEIALPDDQYRRHLQRNCNRLLIRIKFLHYLKEDILKGYQDKILADCNISEIDLPPVPVDGELPAPWWDDEADRSLLVGIFKHGHDKFSLMRQDPCLSFLSKCGPPNKEELLAEMNCADRTVDDLDDENRDQSKDTARTKNATLKDSDAGLTLDDLVENVVKDLAENQEVATKSGDVVDENKNSILKNSSSQDSLGSCENGVGDTSQTNKMDITDDESLTNEMSMATNNINSAVIAAEEGTGGEFLPFPSVNDLNQRFRRLITAYQRNSKKLEIKLAQKARDELKKERTSKFEAAKNEREERKRFLAQKWSRREEADFFRAISSFGVEYDPVQKKHDWNKFRAIGKLDKKLDETLEEYYKAFIVMCKRVLSRPLTLDEEKCPINVDTITEDRASRCLARIEFLNKIRESIITHPELDERLQLCHPQAELPDWWENGKHDKDLLFAAAKHGLTRLDYNLAHDPSLSFDSLIRQKAESLLTQPPTPILIPLEQLQELLEKNEIEYLKDLDLEDDSEDIKAVLNFILDNVEAEETSDSSYKSFAELVDGPHSKNREESVEKSLLTNQRTPPKTTRSSAGLLSQNNRSMPTILSRRGANTIVKSMDSSVGGGAQSVRLTSIGHHTRADDHRVVEIIPILPDTLPDELTKTFEAGEISITVHSESAMLKLDDRAPIILFGAANPVAIKIRWPKDKAIQTRLENLVYLVENNEWPSPPRPSVPTITLPNHLASISNPLTVTTSPLKANEKADVSMGSPKSDISNISSRTSRQDLKERNNELSSSRNNRRGRGRRPRQSDLDPSMSQDMDMPRDDPQATAKLRNLLSQGPSSTRNMGSSVDKLTAKFGNNKQGAGLSSLLASFKQMRGDGGSLSRGGREDKNLLDFTSPATANLIPQILANMKPEYRDLLANQDTAQMLLSSLAGMTGGVGGIGTNLRSSNTPAQFSLDNLLNIAKPSKGPPPAHQSNPPSAHGSSSTRELRRNSQNARENSPPSLNLRSTRGKGSLVSLDSLSQQKSSDAGHSKLGGGNSKKRGRPDSSASDSPPGMPGADVLDLSSLPSMGGKSGSPSRSELRARRHRDQVDDTSSQRSSVPTKANLKSGSKQNLECEQSPEKGGRTTRASKRIGSRIDALALNLQAKRLNRGDSPNSDLSPSLPKEAPMAAHGSGKASGEQKSQSAKAAPPAAHSGSHNKANASEKSNQVPPTSMASGQTSSSSATRQDSLAQSMANSASLFSSLGPLAGLSGAGAGASTSVGGGAGAGDLMSQLLRKAGTNDIVKNLLNEFMKNPNLAFDPNLIATLSATLPLNAQGMPGFNLPTQPATSLPSTSTKTSSSSLLNDFKSPSNSSLMKRSRQESSSSQSSNRMSGSGNGGSSSSSCGSGSANVNSDTRRSSSSSTPERHERRLSSSSSSDKTRTSSYPERTDKHGKHDKRSSGNGQQEPPVGDTSSSSSRRSSSSLLAQQVPTSQQTSQAQTPSSSASTSIPSTLPNAANTLNLANQFGGLNSFGSLLGLPGMSELMKQMSNFPGLAGTLPRVSGAPVVTNSIPTSNTNVQSNGDKSSSGSSSRRSRQSSNTSSQAPQTSAATSQQQAANAALANSLMNSLASQPNAASNPYGNYANPLASPFLPFGLNLGMNNPLASMGLFPNLYMPPGFPTPDQQQQQQQQQQPPNQSGGTSDGGSKDKKMRYPRK